MPLLLEWAINYSGNYYAFLSGLIGPKGFLNLKQCFGISGVYLKVTNEITLYEFNSLSKTEKAEALCMYAVYLLERPHPLFRIALYQVHNFYVEVKYDLVKNAIAEFQLFTNTTLLEPYLLQIDISSVTH